MAERFDEAADFVEVVRRLWDSWEDDAEIRDVATGRFIDRDKLHYIDFEGKWFSVRGPSIVPRPPQGQPLVTALAHAAAVYRFGARSADIVYVTPRDADHARAITQEIAAEQDAGRPCSRHRSRLRRPGGVSRSERRRQRASRKSRLDELAGREYRSDAVIFVGTPAELADVLEEWQGGRPFRLPVAARGRSRTTSRRSPADLVPELQRRGIFRTSYEASTLRSLLGLPRPTNRYAAV